MKRKWHRMQARMCGIGRRTNEDDFQPNMSEITEARTRVRSESRHEDRTIAKGRAVAPFPAVG
jgi:hypothetical protein